LTTFEVAAKHLSFTLAAKELNITHGTVSQQIRILEKALQLPLFIRKHNALGLTPAGSDLFAAVAAGLDAISAGVGLLQPDGQPEP
jgi:DNA-binding transcriptional LysR family regulator